MQLGCISIETKLVSELELMPLLTLIALSSCKFSKSQYGKKNCKIGEIVLSQMVVRFKGAKINV